MASCRTSLKTQQKPSGHCKLHLGFCNFWASASRNLLRRLGSSYQLIIANPWRSESCPKPVVAHSDDLWVWPPWEINWNRGWNPLGQNHAKNHDLWVRQCKAWALLQCSDCMNSSLNRLAGYWFQISKLDPPCSVRTSGMFTYFQIVWYTHRNYIWYMSRFSYFCWSSNAE